MSRRKERTRSRLPGHEDSAAIRVGALIATQAIAVYVEPDRSTGRYDVPCDFDRLPARLRISIPGELELLRAEVSEKMHAVLESLVIDTENDHNTRATDEHVAKIYLTEVSRGRYVPQPDVAYFPYIERISELMIVGPISPS